MKKFKYYVSYTYKNDANFGFGSIEITSTKKIKTIDDLEKIIKIIKISGTDTNENSSIIILNIIKLKKVRC